MRPAGEASVHAACYAVHTYCDAFASAIARHLSMSSLRLSGVFEAGYRFTSVPDGSTKNIVKFQPIGLAREPLGDDVAAGETGVFRSGTSGDSVGPPGEGEGEFPASVAMAARSRRKR